MPVKDRPLTPELYCTSLEASLKLYCEVLGFEILYHRPEHLFAMLNREGAHIMLQEYGGPDREWVPAPLQRPFGRGINLQIMVSDVESLYNDVQNSHAEVTLPLEEKWYRAGDIELGNKQFIVLDPDGYMLRFAEDLGERPYKT